MASFRIRWSESAEEEFRALPFPHRRSLNQRLMQLQGPSLPKGAERIGDSQTHRLAYEAWTVLFDVDESARTILILAIHR